jgi:hypothetical protein
MSFSVTSPWAPLGFTSAKGYAMGVDTFAVNLFKGLDLRPAAMQCGHSHKHIILSSAHALIQTVLQSQYLIWMQPTNPCSTVAQKGTVPALRGLETGVTGPCNTSASHDCHDGSKHCSATIEQ